MREPTSLDAAQDLVDLREAIDQTCNDFAVSKSAYTGPEVAAIFRSALGIEARKIRDAHHHKDPQ